MSRLHYLPVIGLLLCVALAPLPVLAEGSSSAQEDGRQPLQAGIAAFNRGDLEQARSLLEAASAHGLDSSALHYNLGVVYYRLELYELSREQFQTLLGTSHEDLARYNLGLVAQAQGGHDQEARSWFQKVAENAQQKKLRRLARLQLQSGAIASAPAPRSWLGFAALTTGYEDNLALLPDSAASDQSDSFSELVLAGQGPVLELADSASATNTLHLSGSLLRRHYHTESDFSSDAARLGLAWVSRGSLVRREIGLQQSYFRVGADSRELHSSLVLRYRRDHCGGDVSGSRCKLSLTASRVSPFSGFEAYEGMRYRARAGYRRDWNNWRASGRLGLEFNNRDDIRDGDQFVSVSPRRQEVSLGLDYLGWRTWTLGAELGYRYSDYPDAYRLASDPDRESGRRRDHRYSAELTADYVLSAAWTVTGLASYRENESSLKQYRYTNQVYQVSLEYLF